MNIKIKILSLALLFALFAFSNLSYANSLTGSQSGSQSGSMSRTLYISGDKVFLSDIFGVLNGTEDVALFNSPRLGSYRILDFKQLNSLSKKYGLTLPFLSQNEKIILKRNSTQINLIEILPELKSQLADYLDYASVYIKVAGLNNKHYIPAEIDLKSLKWELSEVNQNSNSFKANLKAGLNDSLLKINGRYELEIEIPVLKYSLQRGEAISKENIKYIRLPQSKINSATRTNEKDILGLVAKRTLSAMKPIANSDISQPLMIKRNKSAVVWYENSALSIRLTLVALEDGYLGERIKFKNISSGRIIEATLIGPSQAIILNGASYEELARN